MTGGMDGTASIRSVIVTFFRSYSASSKTEKALKLADLASLIKLQTASEKKNLPWLKLARFGDRRKHKDGVPPAKQSLRHNDNVMAIAGIEGDYDGEIIGVDVAISLLRAAGILAIVYTSPSHTEDSPRWRALCPSSAELPPGQHSSLVDRLNGALGGILAKESWTLSQSYYYGTVSSNPSHRVEVVEGTPIDLLEGLDAIAVGKTGNSEPTPANERPAAAPNEPVSDKRLEAWRISILDGLKRNAIDGQKHHALLSHAKALGGIQAAGGFSDVDAIGWLLDALPATVKDWRLAQQTANDGLAYGRNEPIQLEDRPLPPPPVALDDPRRKAMLRAVFCMLELQPTPDRLLAATYQFNSQQCDPLPTRWSSASSTGRLKSMPRSAPIPAQHPMTTSPASKTS